MKEGQKTIYYFLAPSKEIAQYSPFMEPFTKNEVPVLFISISVEEMIFKQIGKYKDYNFVNIEEQDAEIPKALLKDKQEVDVDKEKLPEAEINSFQNWIKQELSHAVSNVVVSKKLSNSPAMIVSNMTSGMRQMMAFMNQGGEMMDMAKNLTLEINPEHPAIIGINKLRKRDPKEASNNMKQILDLCLLTVGIPFDIKTFMNRSNTLIEKNLSMSLGELDIDPTVTEAEVIEDEVQIEDDNTKTKIEFDENGEPVIKRNK